jgi:hypothetical protein
MAPDLESRAASRRRARAVLVALAVGFSVAAGASATAQPAPILLDDREERDPVVPASSRNAEVRGCLSYEPATVVLRGRLAEGEGTGADGQSERYWALELVEPICVLASSIDPTLNVEETGVTRVHLTLSARRAHRDRPYVEQLIGRTVRAEGTLFHETLVLDAIKVTLDRGHRR